MTYYFHIIRGETKAFDIRPHDKRWVRLELNPLWKGTADKVKARLVVKHMTWMLTLDTHNFPFYHESISVLKRYHQECLTYQTLKSLGQ